MRRAGTALAALILVLGAAGTAGAELVVSYAGELIVIGSAVAPGEPAPGFGLSVTSRQQATPMVAVLANLGVRDDASDWSSGAIVPDLPTPAHWRGSRPAGAGYPRATLYELTLGARFAEPRRQVFPFAEALLGVAAIDAGEPRGDLLASVVAGVTWRAGTQVEITASAGERLYFVTRHLVMPLSLRIAFVLPQ